MAKKTSKRTKKLPTLEAFIACDKVSADPNVGKKTLYGTFDTVILSGLPALAPKFNLYVKIVGGSGVHTLKLRLEGPGGKRVNTESGEDPSFKTPRLSAKFRSDIVVNVDGFPINKTGIYSFVLTSDDREVGRCTLLAKEKDAK